MSDENPLYTVVDRLFLACGVIISAILIFSFAFLFLYFMLFIGA